MIKVYIPIYLFIYINTLEIISFSLEYFYNNTLKNSYSSFLNNLYHAYLFSNIKIGEPEFNIKTLFSNDNSYYSMTTKSKSNKDIKDLSNNYNINNSNTFQNVSLLNKTFVRSKYDIHAKEKFVFNMSNLDKKISKEIIIKDLDFVLGVNTYKLNDTIDIYQLNIGLELMRAQYEKYNLINLLKERKIIDNYNWFITYNNVKRNSDGLYNLDDIINIKGQLILGCFPHDYNSNLFSKNNIRADYSWVMNYKNIYYYNTEKKRQEISLLYRQGIINMNEFLIFAPLKYKILIQSDFFGEYISKNICHYYYDSELEGFYCDKSENFTINNLKVFPTIYFENNIFNYTFELNYKDLFFEKDNKYYFLIVCENGDVDDWFFGLTFIKKYQFAFNQDSKSINFYSQALSNDEENEIIEDKEKNDINKFDVVYLILIIVSWIIFIGFGLLLGKFLFNKYNKKKRANELDDNYEYISDNKKNIN